MTARPRRPVVAPLLTALGFVFLYAPMVILIVYSFNESRLVTVWGGWSTKWDSELVNDQQQLVFIGG